MGLFKKTERVQKIPDGCRADMIKVESSICTGEKTIGFYDRASGRLLHAELVRTDDDIRAFYGKYGIEYK